MVFHVYYADCRRSGENVMSKSLITFIAVVFLAGYAVQPPEKTVSYKVTVREVVYNTLKENHIKNPGDVQPGTELVIRVKEMK